ncbi:hypothetical protein MXB_1066 [Myxobolus squamalis]|nr:hypothetical protein MXB_1066 [Myxobolus squamalis]
MCNHGSTRRNNIYELCNPWMLFPLTHNMHRKILDKNLFRRYNTDHHFALTTKMIVSLFFVRIEEIEIGFEAL